MMWNSQSFMDPSLSLEERIRALLLYLVEDPQSIDFDTTGSGGVELLSANHYMFTVVPKLCSKAGFLHGGAASTLLDTLTSTALLTIAKAGYWKTLGVSRTLTVTFLRPLPLGTKVFVDCEVVAVEKSMANVKGTMKNADGKVSITSIHDKATVAEPKL
ncbi:hypothetical protein GJ744_000932 [Endocarpon pusillum]|uniref:Thioesterase domain-containing protein n=1 Tax=Endocarpon pusillum TaxID=364733 RepID=A0A8H7AT39_9EURO|nr:hypothetical protein GJ744_000932 [Endocarpon pusillum]